MQPTRDRVSAPVLPAGVALGLVADAGAHPVQAVVGVAVAAVSLALRAPFIVVLVLAGAAGALVHVLAG